MELLEACADGDLSAVSALLQGGAAADAVSSDPQTTPLLEAVKNATGTAEHTASVKLLLKASADPDRVPVSGPTGEPPGDSALQHASAGRAARRLGPAARLGGGLLGARL